MPSDPRDYKLDLSSLSAESSSLSSSKPSETRPYLSVHFACCGVYLRIYRSADGVHYAGNCPKCAKPVRFAVGQGGTDSRFFVVR